MLLTVLNVISWLMDAVGFGYTPMVLVLWLIARSRHGGSASLHRAVVTTNTLVFWAGMFVCVDMILVWAIKGLSELLFQRDYIPSRYWVGAYPLALSISRFLVLGLLPLVFLTGSRRASITWSLIIILIWFIWENVMDYLRHGYLCYCDYRPLKTYALLLLTFLGLFGLMYWLIKMRATKGDGASLAQRAVGNA